jgi:hypothetical protein
MYNHTQMADLLGLCRVSCAAHGLNNVVKYGIRASAGAETLITRVRQIVVHYRANTIVKRRLKQVSNDMNGPRRTLERVCDFYCLF